jgi:hypothetical protein
MSSRLLLFLVGCAACAAAAPTLRFDGLLTYCDNPFDYSRSDIDAFRYRTEPARFPIRTSDDVDLNIGAELSALWQLSGRAGAFRARVRAHGYLSNWEKSYGVTAVAVEQGLWHGGRLGFTYTLMPNYIIRYYKNPQTSDTGDYTGCRFAEHLVEARFRQRVGDFALQPQYGYEVDDYNAVFDYYDTKMHRLGGELRWTPAPNLDVRGEYEFRLASAAGPLPDASYNQNEGGVFIRTGPRELTQFRVEAGYSLARRTYTTANSGEEDPAHAGRVDEIANVTAAVRYDLGNVTFVADYDLEWRELLSVYSTEIQEVKDYRSSRLGLGVEVGSGKGRVRR